MKAINCSICGEMITPKDGDSAMCRRCRLEESRPLALGGSGLHPNLLLATLFAVLTEATFYGVGMFFLLRDTAAYHLFCGHGWVPYLCVFFFFCATWGLVLKISLLRRQQSAFELQLLPAALDAHIEAGDAQRILDRISRLTRRQRSLLLVMRVRQALLRLEQLGTAEKLDDLLRYRAEADETAMESSYAAPKFIVWAIPVLGFVGTVIGISNGVQAFSSLIQNASDLEGLRESLKGVTYGLGQAFETTMIALCMSLCLMLMISWLQCREDRLLAAIDDYCMENLLHKVNMPRAAGVSAEDLSGLVQAIRELTQQWREMQSARRQDTETGRADGAGLGFLWGWAMSHRRARQVEIFNFSFLDILACTIGLLIFIMVMVFILESSSRVADSGAIISMKLRQAASLQSATARDTEIAAGLEVQLEKIQTPAILDLTPARDSARASRDAARAATTTPCESWRRTSSIGRRPPRT